ncbi:MAG: hypothetical protein F6K25_15250 [Okeania sp. SIO2G4]|uniref:hypothetical protein n=1 Tax=unclassified Okeania TaxID=2634635 RepID=UPI0013B76430|nr:MULTISPECIES: hypothetical protein [unclassified Okeania]NEP74102.1 hypothetical protein [Okeania sp. SIO2G5]NEP96055.1 hypothetical protein [Okeania sp. SIO2F5]NEQ91978.1 hypothetical protein [Okeania sp. SIO2G4]
MSSRGRTALLVDGQPARFPRHPTLGEVPKIDRFVKVTFPAKSFDRTYYSNTLFFHAWYN